MNAPTDWLITTAGQGAAGLLVWSWQALALLALVWLALKILRMKSPALRHQVWLFGLIAVAALPLSSLTIQRFPSLRPASPALNYVAEAPQVVIDFASQPPVQTLPEMGPGKAATASPVKTPAKTPIVPPSLFSALFAALFAVWMIGALITMARLAQNHLGLRRAFRRAQPGRLADLDCDESALSAMGKINLRRSTEIHSPILFGVFRPTILLPADITDWTTPAERAAMIQHELAHVERRDTIVNLFQTALSVIFFFHPLVRYACRQLSLEREMACDDRVVALGVAAEDYAAGILKAAERSVIAVGPPGGAHQLAIFGARQILERRIEMILNTDRPRMLAHQWRYLVLPIAIIAVAGFLLIPRSSAQNSSSNGPANSAQEQEMIEMIRQVAESTPHRKAGSHDERLHYADFRLYDKRSSVTIIPPSPMRARGIPRLTKVEVGDFEVSVNGDSAVIDFIGAIHLSFPDQDKEEVVTNPLRVELVKVNGQWQADRRNRYSAAGMRHMLHMLLWSRPPIATALEASSPETPRAGSFYAFFSLGITTEMIAVNNGDAEFSVQSSPSFDSSQSGEASPVRSQAIQDAVMKLGELELRGKNGARLSHVGANISRLDMIRFKDHFELQWGERIYFGSGPVRADYRLSDKLLLIQDFPETRLYRTPDRNGEAMTLQQVAQELKDQSLRKN